MTLSFFPVDKASLSDFESFSLLFRKLNYWTETKASGQFWGTIYFSPNLSVPNPLWPIMKFAYQVLFASNTPREWAPISLHVFAGFFFWGGGVFWGFFFKYRFENPLVLVGQLIKIETEVIYRNFVVSKPDKKVERFYILFLTECLLSFAL